MIASTIAFAPVALLLAILWPEIPGNDIYEHS